MKRQSIMAVRSPSGGAKFSIPQETRCATLVHLNSSRVPGGDLPQTVDQSEKAAENTVIRYAPANGMLARVCIESGRFDDAIATLNRLSPDSTKYRPSFRGSIPKAFYIFLDIWNQADQELAEAIDAKERLDRLVKRP